MQVRQALREPRAQQGLPGARGRASPRNAPRPPAPAGQDGQDGGGSSALIISTGQVVTDDTTGGFITGIPDLSAEEDSLLSNSVVLVYLKAQGVYWPMPGIISFGGGKVSSFTFVHAVQNSTFFVELIPTDWNEQQETPPTRTFEDIRVVIVPGEIISGGRLSAEFLKDYNKTIAALGLTDAKVQTATKLNMRLKRK